jgi:hypothetical protein
LAIEEMVREKERKKKKILSFVDLNYVKVLTEEKLYKN